MTTESFDSRRARRRHRLAAEPILGDSSLRDALTDREAERLLRWALGRLRTTVWRTADLAEELAVPIVEEEASFVSDVMRQVNRLVESWRSGSMEEARVRLQALRIVLEGREQHMAGVGGEKALIDPGQVLQLQPTEEALGGWLSALLDAEEE